jgi:hypothetical protein
VRSAGVLGDVAADRARTLARRIRRVERAGCLDLARDPEVDHAGLRDHPPVAQIDRLDRLQAAGADHDRGGQRQGSTREAGAGAARHERHAVGREDADDLGHLLRRARQDHQIRGAALEGVAVALVDQQGFRAVHQGVAPDDRREPRQQARRKRAPADARGVGSCGHAPECA